MIDKHGSFSAWYKAQNFKSNRNGHELRTICNSLDDLLPVVPPDQKGIVRLVLRVVGLDQVEKGKKWSVCRAIEHDGDELVSRQYLRQAYRSAALDDKMAEQNKRATSRWEGKSSSTKSGVKKFGKFQGGNGGGNTSSATGGNTSGQHYYKRGGSSSSSVGTGTAAHHIMSTTATGASIFPLSAIEVPITSTASSRRLQTRNKHAQITTSTANETIHALNSLYYNHKPPSQNRITTFTKQQQRLTTHIYSCARYHNRRRVLAKSNIVCDESLSELLNSEHYSHLLSAGYSHSISAVPLVADRVALPNMAGAVDLLGTLPSDI